MPALCLAQGAGPAAGFGDRGDRTWRFSLASGFDTYAQTYFLAEEDTSEVITEASIRLVARGASPRRVRHRWLLRPEIAFGTEVMRERLDFDYRFQPDSTRARLRLEGSWSGRQYVGGTDYSLSSDSREARGSARWYVPAGGERTGELRLLGRRLRYRIPSLLEVDHDRIGAFAYLRNGILAERRWNVGLGVLRRTHPDSSAIDRTRAAAEIEYDGRGWEGGGLYLRHRSERRWIRDPAAKSHQ